jgi:DNA-binding response OmpR family regulator
MNTSLMVLLIEDNPEFAALVQQWLSRRIDDAFLLEWVDSLRAGLSRLNNGGIDVILLDLGLSDSGGIETFTRIKAQAPNVPVILLSGDNSEQLALRLVRVGAQEYIVYKGSCSRESLLEAIQDSVVGTSQNLH